MAAPKVHIRKRGDRYQVAVPVGRDPVTPRYRYVYESARNLERVIREVLPGMRLRELEKRVDVLDGIYAELRLPEAMWWAEGFGRPCAACGSAGLGLLRSPSVACYK
jgi:hypothetical protein